MPSTADAIALAGGLGHPQRQQLSAHREGTVDGAVELGERPLELTDGAHRPERLNRFDAFRHDREQVSQIVRELYCE